MNRLRTVFRNPFLWGVILVVVVLCVRSVNEAWSAWDRGTDALVEFGDRQEAIFQFRTASRWSIPGFTLPRQATEKILELASEALAECEQCVEEWTSEKQETEVPSCSSCSLAIYGFDSGRAGILGSRSFYTPNKDLLEPLNRGMVRALVLAAEVDPLGPRALPENREARAKEHRAQLRVDHSPPTLPAFGSTLGFLLWLGGAAAGIRFWGQRESAEDKRWRNALLVSGAGLLMWFIFLTNLG